MSRADDIFDISEPEREQSTPRSKPLKLERASDVKPEKLHYLMTRMIPFGYVTVLDGKMGVGKSTALLDVVARGSRGVEMPDGTPHPTPSKGFASIILTPEDSAAVTIVPKLMKMGAARELVYLEKHVDDDGYAQLALADPQHLVALRDAIRETSARLVIIDPLFAYTAGIRTSNDSEMRQVLGPLAAIARETGAAIVCTRHVTKSRDVTEALFKGGGSVAIAAAVRSLLLAIEDPERPQGYLWASAKCSTGAKPPALRYEIVGDGPDDAAAICRWCGTFDVEANDLVGTDEDTSKTAQIADLLREILADGRQVAGKDVRTQIEQKHPKTGESVITAACRRARVDRSGRDSTFQGGTFWRLAHHSNRRGATGGGGGSGATGGSAE